MLVLSRKLGESIVIGTGVTVSVARLSRSRVSLVIDAPGGTSVLRNELVPLSDKHLLASRRRRLTEMRMRSNEMK